MRHNDAGRIYLALVDILHRMGIVKYKGRPRRRALDAGRWEGRFVQFKGDWRVGVRLDSGFEHGDMVDVVRVDGSRVKKELLDHVGFKGGFSLWSTRL